MDCTRRIPSACSGGMLSSLDAYCTLAPYIIGACLYGECCGFMGSGGCISL